MSTISSTPPSTTTDPTESAQTTKQASSNPDTVGAQIFAATVPAAVFIALFWIIFFFKIYVRKKEKGDVETPNKLKKPRRQKLVSRASDRNLSMEERIYHYHLRREITEPESPSLDFKLIMPPNAMTKPQILQVDPPLSIRQQRKPI